MIDVYHNIVNIATILSLVLITIQAACGSFAKAFQQFCLDIDCYAIIYVV